MNLFNLIIEDIKTEYETNPNNNGWRFLITSKETLGKNNGIAFITLNPGGSAVRKDHSCGSYENGCAYLSETWAGGNNPGESSLQKQFQFMFREIAYQLNIDDFKQVMESSLCGYFIPFRSQSFDSLNDKKRCVEFSNKIWEKILSAQRFKVILCIDKVTYKNIDKILCESDLIKMRELKFDTGWGNYKAVVSKYKSSKNVVTLARFPHLSRFSIFGRAESAEYIKLIMNDIFE